MTTRIATLRSGWRAADADQRKAIEALSGGAS